MFAAWAGGLALVLAQPAAPEGLSDEAKVALKRRMVRHASEMEALVRAVVLLKRDEVQALARKVAEAPRIVPPEPGDTDAPEAPLPVRFFSLQDALHLRAGELERAAARGTDPALARAFGQLAETCVQCHALLKLSDGTAGAKGPRAPAARPPP